MIPVLRCPLREKTAFPSPILASVVASSFDLVSAQDILLHTPPNDTLSIQKFGLRRLLDTISPHPPVELKTVCLFIREGERWLEEDEVGRSRSAEVPG